MIQTKVELLHEESLLFFHSVTFFPFMIGGGTGYRLGHTKGPAARSATQRPADSQCTDRAREWAGNMLGPHQWAG